MIEIPNGWTNAIYHSSAQKYLDKLLLNGLIAGGTGRKEGRQACYFSAAHSQIGEAVLGQGGSGPQIVPYMHHKWYTDT